LTSGNPYKEFCPTAENQGPTLYIYTLGFPDKYYPFSVNYY